MRKILTIILILVLAVSMTVALVACTPEQIVLPDDQNPDKIPTVNDGVSLPAPLAALKEIIASFDNKSGNASFNISLPTRLNGKSYSVKLLGNVPTNDDEELELLVQISDTDKVLFGFYIVNDKIFVEVFDNYKNNSVKIHIEDIEANYLVGLLSKLNFSAITDMIDGLLGDLAGLSLSNIIDIVVPMLFKTISYKTATNVTDMVLRLDITEILGLVSSFIPELDNLVKDIMVPDGLGTFVAGIVDSLPTFHVDIHSLIKDGKSSVFDVSLVTEEEVFGISADVNFNSNKIDIGLPDDIESYEPFSILNIAFNVNLGIHTNGLDMGKLINTLVPNTLPENLLVFTSDRDLTLKVNINLDSKDNNKNLILLELYNGTDTTIDANRMLGAYFIDGTLKVNVTDISNAINIPNIEIKGLNISALISNVANLLTSTIDGAIDSLFPSDEASQSALSDTSMIVPATVGYTGDAVISADVTAFVQALTKVFRMSDFVKLEENALTIDVNADFFTSLETLVPSLSGSLDTFKNIGALSLAVNLAPWGIDNVDLTYRPTNDNDNIFNVNINSFLLGFETPDLEKTIRLRTYNKEYSSNIEGILKGALDGIELKGNLELALKKGSYNLASLLSGLVALPALDVAIPEDVILDIDLKLQLSYDVDAPEDPDKTQGLFEITLNNDISIFKKGKLIGLYIMGNDLYLEINGIGDLNIPKIKVKTDFMTLLHKEIQNLKYDLNFEGVLEGLIPSPSNTTEQNTPATTASALNSVASGTAMDSILNIIDLNINETTLNIAVTSMALQKLFAKFGTDITLPPLDLTASITDIDDITIKINALDFISLKAQITYANIGREVAVELPAINPDDYAGDLQVLVANLLKGVDLQAHFKVSVKKGFDLRELLNGMPLPIDLNLVFTEDVTLGIDFKLQMSYDENNAANNKFLLELKLTDSIQFLKAGDLIKIYGTKDALYVEIAEIGGIKIPKIKFDIDVMSMLNDMVGSLDLDFIINAGGGGESDPTPSPAAAILNEMANTSPEFDSDTIFIKQNYIKLYITSELIFELLKQFGVIADFTLPEFDLSIEIGDGSTTPGFTGIFIEANMGSMLEAEFNVTKFTAGQPVNFQLPQINDGYLDSISNIAASLLQGVELEAELGITLHAGEHNLAAIFQLFPGVALPDVVISIPEQILIRAKITVKLAYDENNPNNSKILVELYLFDNILGFINGSDSVPFLSVYGVNKKLYLEANNTVGFTIPKVSAEIDLFGMLMAELDKIDIQDMIYGAINGGSGDEGGDTPATVANADNITLEINNDSLKLYTTMTAILNLIKTLSPGTDISIPNFDLSLEFNGLDDIRFNADKMLNAMSLSLKFGIKKIGTPVHIADKDIKEEEYNGSLSSLAEDILDGVNIEADLNLTLYKGIYDVSELLKDLISLPPIVLDVQENTVLNISLKLQLKYVVEIVDGIKVTSASQLLFELYLNNDVAFASAGKLLGVYGQDGALYCELATLMDVSIPKIRVDVDVFDLLNKILEKEDINFIINSNKHENNSSDKNADNTPKTVADTTNSDDNITATINKDSLKLMIAANAFAELLKLVIPDIILPPVDLSAEITGLEGISISLGVGSYLTASLGFKNVILGDETLVVDMPEFNSSDFVGDLQTVVREVLEGIDLEATASISFLPGEHDIASLLALFGVIAPPITFTVPGVNPVKVDLKLIVQMKKDAVIKDADGKDIVGGAARIELWIMNDALIFNGDKLLLGAYVKDGKTYLEVSPDGAIDGINNVKVELGLDLMKELENIIAGISETFVIDTNGIFKTEENNDPATDPKTTAGISEVSDKAGSGSIGITIKQKSLQIAVTASAIQQLLAQFGINVTLPDFDLTVAIDSVDGITLGADLMGMIGLDVTLTKTTIGDSSVRVELPDINPDEYSKDLNDIFDAVLVGTKIEGNIKLTLTKDFNINELIDTLGIPFDMPPITIAIPDGGITIDARLLIEFKYDSENPNNSKALIEIWLNEAPILFDNENIRLKPFIGVYYENGKIYAEINNIRGVKVPKIMLQYDFMGELKTIIAKMQENFDFSNITFGKEIAEGGNEGEVEPQQVAMTYAMRSNDKINIEVQQNTLVVAMTLNAIKQLLKAFNVNLDIPDIDLSAEITVKTLQDISLSVGAGVNGNTMLELDLDVKALTFGDENLVVDLKDKIVRKDGVIVDDAYNSNLQDLLKDVLSGVELNADFSLQIKKDFDLANFLDGLGVSLPNLDISFPSDIVLDVSLKVQLKYDANDISNSVGKIELYANESVLFINKGLLMAIYIQGNDFYIQIGERYDAENPDKILGGIAGVTVPIIKVQTDVLTFLNEKIAGIDVSFILDKEKTEEKPNPEPATVADIDSFGEDDLNISINKDALILKATNIAIQQLLDEFGLNIGFILPDFSIYGELKGLDYIKLNVNHNDLVIVDLAFKGLNLGDASITVNDMPDFSGTAFSDNIAGIVDEVLQGVDLEANLKLELKGGEYNIAEIINSFGLALPDIFITIDDNDNAGDGYGNIILDATLKLQLSIDKNVTANTRGLLEIWLNKDIAIAKASDVKPLLGVYIIGDSVYLEINNLENVTIPKIKLKADIGSIIAGLLEESKEKIAIKIKDMIGGGETPNPNPAPASYSTVDNSLISDQNISVSVNQNTIKLMATAEALTAFLSNIGVAINWPDIDISAEITNVDGTTIAMKVGADVLDIARVDLSLSKMIIGKPVTIDTGKVNDDDYNSSLKTIVENLLNGIDISGNINLTLPIGKYDFAAFLKQFGVEIPPIAYNLSRELPLESRFVLKTAYDSANPINSKAIIEWVITNPDDVFFLDQQKSRIGENGKETVMFGFYLDNNVTYLDLSNIIIANIRLPKIKLNSNILSTLANLIDSLNVDLDLNGLFGDKTNNGGAQVADITTLTDPVAPSIGISSQALHLKVTAAAIQLLLSSFGVNVELPDFDITADITELTGINLSFNMGFTGNQISLDIKNVKAKFGEVPAISIPEELNADDAYGSTISDIILKFIGDVDISGKVNINSAKSTLNITSIINAIMATTGQYFDLPININMDDFSNILYFDIKWHLDQDNPRASEAAISIFSSEGKFTISIYLQNGNLYVDLSGVGLMQFTITNFNFTGFISGMLEKIEPMLTQELSTVLDNLLSDITTVSDASTLATPEEMARNAQSYNKMQALMDEAAAGDEVFDLISVILSALDLTDTLISLDFEKAFIEDLISRAGVYLGLDLFGGIKFDIMKGTLDGNATINELKLDFDFNINTFGDYGSMKDKVYYYNFLGKQDADGLYPTVPDVPNVANYTEYSLISTLDILQSILGNTSSTTQGGNLVPLAYVDMYNSAPESLALGAYYDDPSRYGGYGNGGTTRLYIERVTGYDSFAGPKGSLKIGLFKDFEMSANPINIGLNIEAGRLKVLGTKNLLDYLVVDGSLLNLDLEVDLKGILGPLIDPILKELPEDMYIRGNATNDAIAPTADITASGDDAAAFNITDYLKSINLNMFETGTTKLDLEMNGKTISDLLVGILQDLFMGLDINGTGDAANLDYKYYAERGSGFYDQLWNKVIQPVISNAAGTLASTVAGVAKGKIAETISRLLPLPMFTDMTISATFADSKFKSIEVATENSARTTEKLRLNIYPAGQTQVVDWGYIPGSVVYDPYSTEGITSQFEGKYATRNDSDGGAHWKNGDIANSNTAKASLITYSGDYDALKAMDASGSYAPGTYTITATSTFYKAGATSGNRATESFTKDITITILERGEIISVEDVYVQSYGDVPNQVVANVKLSDESIVKRLIKGVKIDSTREGYLQREHSTTVNLGGNSVPVKVVYLDSTISRYDGEFNIDAYSMISLAAKLPSRVFFQYGSGYFSSQEVVWDTSALNGLTKEDWIKGGKEFEVTASIPDGTSNPQTLTYKVKLRTTEINSVQFDGENTVNTLTVDPYRAIQEKAAAVLATESSVFPANVTVIYTDGRRETMPVTWSGMGNYEYNAQGGTTTAQITNTIGDYTWTHDVTVNVLARTIKYVSFGKDADGNDIKELAVNPYEYLHNNSVLPTSVYAVFEEGEPVQVPCSWTIPDGTITPAGGYKQVTLTIMPDNENMKTSFKPLLNIQRMNVVDVVLPKDEDNKPQYVLNDAVSVLYGGLKVSDIKPSHLEFLLDTGKTARINVNVNFDSISVTENGGTFKDIIFTLPDGKQFKIDVVIPKLIASGTPVKTIDISATDLAELGTDAFPPIWDVEFNGIVHKVNVTWILDSVTMNGGTALMIVGDGSRPDLRIKIQVNVINAESQQAAA